MKAFFVSKGDTTFSMLEMLEDAAVLSKPEVWGILDDDVSAWGESFNGIPVKGAVESAWQDVEVKKHCTHFAVGLAAIKHVLIRRYMFERSCREGFTPLSCMHPQSYVSAHASVGQGTFICPGACVGPFTRLGNNGWVYFNASVAERCIIGDNVIIQGNVFIGGGVEIGDDVYIGPNAVIGSGARIGAGSVVGAGSVILKTVSPGMLVSGNPSQQVENYLYLSPPEKR